MFTVRFNFVQTYWIDCEAWTRENRTSERIANCERSQMCQGRWSLGLGRGLVDQLTWRICITRSSAALLWDSSAPKASHKNREVLAWVERKRTMWEQWKNRAPGTTCWGQISTFQRQPRKSERGWQSWHLYGSEQSENRQQRRETGQSKHEQRDKECHLQRIAGKDVP